MAWLNDLDGFCQRAAISWLNSAGLGLWGAADMGCQVGNCRQRKRLVAVSKREAFALSRRRRRFASVADHRLSSVLFKGASTFAFFYLLHYTRQEC